MVLFVSNYLIILDIHSLLSYLYFVWSDYKCSVGRLLNFIHFTVTSSALDKILRDHFRLRATDICLWQDLPCHTGSTGRSGKLYPRLLTFRKSFEAENSYSKLRQLGLNYPFKTVRVGEGLFDPNLQSAFSNLVKLYRWISGMKSGNSSAQGVIDLMCNLSGFIRCGLFKFQNGLLWEGFMWVLSAY